MGLLNVGYFIYLINVITYCKSVDFEESQPTQRESKFYE